MPKMRALLLVEPEHLEIGEVAVPEIGPEQILVKVGTCGTCHTDIRIYHGLLKWSGGRIDPAKEYPILFGHEVTGTVVERGSAVTNVAVGDRVLLRITYTGYAEYCKTEAINAVRLPDDISFEHGVIGQLMPIALHGVIRGMAAGDNVLVVGAGPAGLVSVGIARALGAAQIVVTDLHEQKFARARKVGADYALVAGETVLDDLQALDVPFDVAIECVGIEPAFRQAEQAVRPGGTIILFGSHLEPMSLNLLMWETRSLSLVVAREQPDETPALLNKTVELMATGQIVPRDYISHIFKLEDAQQAFDLLIDHPEQCAKMAIVPWLEE